MKLVIEDLPPSIVTSLAFIPLFYSFQGKSSILFTCCKEEELRRTLFTQEFPIQSVKLVIEDLAPSDSVQWPRDVLDLLHSCLVEQQLRVELVTRPTCFPLVGKVYLGNIDIGKLLLDSKLAKLSSTWRYEDNIVCN